MCQGMNKPGRIGGVGIGRKLNTQVQYHIQQYMTKFLKDTSYWNRFEYMRLTREYQAMGRILRCETDYGCVALMSHDYDEVQKLQRFFSPEVLQVVRDAPRWPSPPEEEDVQVTGERSWEERDAELRLQAVDVESSRAQENAVLPVKTES